MLTRFFLMFFGLSLLLTAALLSLLPLLVVRGKLDELTYMTALCLWAVLASLSCLLVLGLLVRKIWFFRGTGEPVTFEQLREQLLSVNTMAGPVQVCKRRKKLIFTWRYKELQWCELFSGLGINRLYELHCRFDPTTRTVFLADRTRAADFLICPERVKIGFRRIPLPLLSVRPRRLDTLSQYATKEPHEYNFRPREIKAPVMGTILASGWNVRLSLF